MLGLTRSCYVALLIAKQYLEASRKDYITYNAIKSYATRNRLYNRYSITDRTLERSLRELARMGYFKRIYLKNRKVVLYKPTQAFYEFLKRYQAMVNRYEAQGV